MVTIGTCMYLHHISNIRAAERAAREARGAFGSLFTLDVLVHVVWYYVLHTSTYSTTSIGCATLIKNLVAAAVQ